MAKFLIEGSCDGALFSEAIKAPSVHIAESMAIDRLCEAWGVERDDDTELEDLGDCASVREYDADDYARDAAGDMLAALRTILPFISQEVEGRKHGGNNEDWADLEAAEASVIGAIRKASGGAQ